MSEDLTQQQEIFIDVYFEEIGKRTNRPEAARVAAKAAGYSEGTNVHQTLRRLKDHIISRATDELAMILPKTVERVESVLDDPMQEGARTILEAAASIMDRGGVVKRDKLDILVKQPDGLIVMPPKKID